MFAVKSMDEVIPLYNKYWLFVCVGGGGVTCLMKHFTKIIALEIGQYEETYRLKGGRGEEGFKVKWFKHENVS